MKRILVIAAHPDDEALGCGGTLAKLSAAGSEIHVAFLADGISSRTGDQQTNVAELTQRRIAGARACETLGVQSYSFDDLPDNRLDTIPMLDIAKKVEKLIGEHRPDTVFTHHSGDVNIDHQRLHQAVVTACRPQPGHCVRSLLFFEVASSTEWQVPNSHTTFNPNWFCDISATLDRKMAALEIYSVEMRTWPHARSLRAVQHLASWRGATVGVEAAEAFILGRAIQ